MSDTNQHSEQDWRELIEWLDATLGRIEADQPYTPSIQDIQFAQRTISELAGVVRGLEEQLEASQKALLAILQDPLGSHGAKAVARQALGIPYPETSFPATKPARVWTSAEVTAIGLCSTPSYHVTHRYCPSCPWTEEYEEPDPAKERS